MLDGFCERLGLDRIDLVANDTGGVIAKSSPPITRSGSARSD